MLDGFYDWTFMQPVKMQSKPLFSTQCAEITHDTFGKNRV